MSEILSVKKRIVKICNAFRVGKDGKNTFSNYDYFKPDDILKTLNPLLEEHELISIFNLKTHETRLIINSILKKQKLREQIKHRIVEQRLLMQRDIV